MGQRSNPGAVGSAARAGTGESRIEIRGAFREALPARIRAGARGTRALILIEALIDQTHASVVRTARRALGAALAGEAGIAALGRERDASTRDGSEPTRRTARIALAQHDAAEVPRGRRVALATCGDAGLIGARGNAADEQRTVGICVTLRGDAAAMLGLAVLTLGLRRGRRQDAFGRRAGVGNAEIGLTRVGLLCVRVGSVATSVRVVLARAAIGGSVWTRRLRAGRARTPHHQEPLDCPHASDSSVRAIRCSEVERNDRSRDQDERILKESTFVSFRRLRSIPRSTVTDLRLQLLEFRNRLLFLAIALAAHMRTLHSCLASGSMHALSRHNLRAVPSA